MTSDEQFGLRAPNQSKEMSQDHRRREYYAEVNRRARTHPEGWGGNCGERVHVLGNWRRRESDQQDVFQRSVPVSF